MKKLKTAARWEDEVEWKEMSGLFARLSAGSEDMDELLNVRELIRNLEPGRRLHEGRTQGTHQDL